MKHNNLEDMIIDDNDDEHDDFESMHVDQKCQCEGKKEIIFECKDCRNVFCEDCPNSPIGNNCVECMIIETTPISPTPVKRN